jgi:hypothetical protein
MKYLLRGVVAFIVAASILATLAIVASVIIGICTSIHGAIVCRGVRDDVGMPRQAFLQIREHAGIITSTRLAGD